MDKYVIYFKTYISEFLMFLTRTYLKKVKIFTWKTDLTPELVLAELIGLLRWKIPNLTKGLYLKWH